MNTEDTSLKQYICDTTNQKTYQQGSLLGDGSFGEYYKLTDIANGDTYTVKFVRKIPVTACNWEDKISTEVAIHKTLMHKHIIKFHSYFDDMEAIYILLQPCGQLSFLRLIKTRRVLTDPEVRYYLKQIVLAIEYIHEQGIIHRDLKLGNIFIDNNMNVQVGDFGYATILSNEGDKCYTHHGSPNYVAPEILDGSGYGQEVDIWAIGCIMYALLVGQLPFTSYDVQETYTRIVLGRYTIPNTIHLCAARMIRRLLNQFPHLRPKASSLVREPFFLSGFIPKILPQSSIKNPPFLISPEKCLNSKECISIKNYSSLPKQCTLLLDRKSENHLTHLKTQLLITLSFDVKDRPLTDDCNEVFTSQSVRWICSWVDLSDNYGFGYKLNDGSTGILFVDGTKFILYDKKSILYVDENDKEELCNLDSYPLYLKQKIKIYNIFEEHLLTSYQRNYQNNSIKQHGNEQSLIAYVSNWICYKQKTIMKFSNGMLQISYVSDDVIVLVCLFNRTITFIDKRDIIHSFSLELIERNGCTKELERKLWYAWREVHEMIRKKNWLIVQMY